MAAFPPISGPSRRALVTAAGAAAGAALAAPAAWAQAPDTPRFVAALNGRDDLRAWGDAAVAACAGWWPRIVAALPDPTFVPPAQVTLAVMRIGLKGVPAATRGDVIGVDADFLAAHPGDPDDVDLLAHELTHVAQRYPAPRSGWLTEGIADWIRYYVLLPDDPHRAFRPPASYASGYQPAAALLDWCERRRPGLVAGVHQGMRRGEDGTAALERLAGASADDLWRACPASHLGARAR